MARKHRPPDQELPFIALMDTMTNVVGVLTIVLVMIGLSLASAVSRVFSSLPPATPEQIAAIQAEVDRLREVVRPDQEKLEAMARPDPVPLDVAAIDREVARLEQAARDKGIKVFSAEALTREQAKREAELKLKKDAMDQLLAERDRIKALLDETPVSKPPPAKVVRLPAGRPIPEGAQIEHILVATNGAHWIDIEGAKEAFLREFKSSAIRETVKDRIKRGDKTLLIYDHEKLARYFATRKLSFREFRMEVVFATWTSSPILKLVPTAPAGGLQNDLRRIRSNPKAVVLFHVTAPAFEQYLSARELCDDIGVPAGWEFTGEASYSIAVYDIETSQPKKIPPPAAPAGPGAIKAPSRTLD